MRLLVLLFGCSFWTAATALAQGLAISPAKPTVRQGESTQFTANRTVTWSLRSGSAGSISPSGVYTAPAHVDVKQKAGPCQLIPPDHMFATRVDTLPTHRYSALMMSINDGNFALTFEPSFWTNVTTNTSPTFAGNFYYTPLNNGDFQVLEWPKLKTETGVFMPPFNNTDNHEVYVNRETCEFTDLYNRYPVGANVVQNCPLCTGQSGVRYTSDFNLPTSGATDAAGLAQQPVSLTLADIQSGEVRHALRFSMANGYILPSYVWPATANAIPFCSFVLTDLRGCFEYGMYVRLKSNVDLSGFSPKARMVLEAIKRYGMILTDGGLSYAIQTNTDVWMDAGMRSALREITGKVRSRDLEVVDTSAMQLNASQGAVKIGNGYQNPSQFAEVVATDAQGNQTSVRINLRGVTVGVAEPMMTVMAGHTVDLQGWATGSDDVSLNWTMSPEVGTLDPSTGRFTAPRNISEPTPVRITATSGADETAKAYIDVTVWPDNDGGAVRMNLGHTGSEFVDGDGHTWWRDEWAQVEGFGYAWTGGPPETVYAETRYYYGDGRLKWYLPNGNYKARIYMSINTGPAAVPLTQEEYVCHVDVQGQLYRRDFRIGSVTNWARFTGGYLDVPMQVTDGSAYLALRYRGPSTVQTHHCSWSAVEITPEASNARLEIDNPPAEVLPGQRYQLNAAGWLMPAQVNWSLVRGPGSVTASGAYTVPLSIPATQTAVLRATSATDPSKTLLAFVQLNGTALSVCSVSGLDGLVLPASGADVPLRIQAGSACTPDVASGASWLTLNGAPTSDTVNLRIAANPNATERTTTIRIFGQTQNVRQLAATPAGLLYVPIAPCRLVDTRSPEDGSQQSGAFGMPRLESGAAREIPVPFSGACNVPSSAVAYSGTLTAIALSDSLAVTLYPTGLSKPSGASLKMQGSPVQSNSFVVAAGVNGAFTLSTSDPAHAVVDLNGYFIPNSATSNTGLAYYPLTTACRVTDTTGRVPAAILAGDTLTINPRGNPSCVLPSTSATQISAYGVRVTAMPENDLGFLTLYRTGDPRPLTSVLTGGDGTRTVETFAGASPNGFTLAANGNTNVAVDLNGYFAAPSSTTGLRFYPLAASTCQVMDTASGDGGDALEAGEIRNLPVARIAACGVPTAAARILLLNATASPVDIAEDGSVEPLDALSLWPTGATPPASPQLRSPRGLVTSGLLTTSTGANNSGVQIQSSRRTHLAVSVVGYFAP